MPIFIMLYDLFLVKIQREFTVAIISLRQGSFSFQVAVLFSVWQTALRPINSPQHNLKFI
jgi:hypothetical protein